MNQDSLSMRAMFVKFIKMFNLVFTEICTIFIYVRFYEIDDLLSSV